MITPILNIRWIEPPIPIYYVSTLDDERNSNVAPISLEPAAGESIHRGSALLHLLVYNIAVTPTVT